nr:unnamed protein product [Callosobruchus chinensis]
MQYRHLSCKTRKAYLDELCIGTVSQILDNRYQTRDAQASTRF